MTCKQLWGSLCTVTSFLKEAPHSLECRRFFFWHTQAERLIRNSSSFVILELTFTNASTRQCFFGSFGKTTNKRIEKT